MSKCEYFFFLRILRSIVKSIEVCTHALYPLTSLSDSNEEGFYSLIFLAPQERGGTRERKQGGSRVIKQLH